MEHDALALRIRSARVRLVFLEGVLAQARDGLSPVEMEGLVCILTDILTVIVEVGGLLDREGHSA